MLGAGSEIRTLIYQYNIVTLQNPIFSRIIFKKEMDEGVRFYDILLKPKLKLKMLTL